jgi:ABC-type multidrug transport system ATPase subunit
MKLIVKNFDAIKEATIDLSKKVYLFVGYNNAGKTYMSKLIFKIFRQETLNKFLKSDEYQGLAKTIFFLQDKSIELGEKLVNDILKNFAIYLEKDIDFASSPSIEFSMSNKKQLFNDSITTTVGVGFGNGNSYEIYSFKKEAKSNIMNFIDHNFLKNLPIDIYDKFPKKKIEEIYNDRVSDNELKEKLVTSIIKKLFNSQNLTSHFFAADRNFYLKNNDWAANKKVQQLNEIRETLKKRTKEHNVFYPEELLLMSEQNYADAEDSVLTPLYKLEQDIKNGDEKINDYYNNILIKFNDILGGKIVHELITLGAIKAVRWKFLFEDWDNKVKTLELSKVSSAVNQLSTLSLYLQYFAEEQQNFLFIDEPEENLHPLNQIKFLNLLLEFASMNENRLLMTTHSPLLAEHLNNYLYASYIRNEKQDFNAEVENLTAFNPDVTIDSKDVAIYFFENNHKLLEYKHKQFGVAFSDFNAEKAKISELKDLLTEQIYELGK